MKDIKITNRLLLAIVIPLVFYVLKLLSFIFIPLVASMFIALLFLPLMRWLKKKKIPKPMSVFMVILIIAGALKMGIKLILLSSKEIIASKAAFFEKALAKRETIFTLIESFFGMQYNEGQDYLTHFIQEEKTIIQNVGSMADFIGNTLSMTLMTAFFVVLWLGESINFQKVLNSTILKQKRASVKTFMKIEKDLIKFMKVKFLISLFTGLGIGLSCYYFDVSFPIFWGLFAFVINFIQMIGSFISVILLSLFAFVELDPTSTLLFFIIAITAVQILFGGILEPVFMGKSFSINIITILIMLMFWGYIWGIPGLIMSIPITVFIKIILDQFPKLKLLQI
ncbi:MAG: AI-2E family transporter [Flavobacteriaceae bacterium]|nr:AI-2E family transporter [Flavobacteriaceae bacterium]